MKLPRRKATRVRKFWAIVPATRVIPDKTKRPWRKQKHKARIWAE